MANVNAVIAPRLKGRSPNEQGEIDDLMRKLDGTPNKSKLGANAILIKRHQSGTVRGTLETVAMAQEAGCGERCGDCSQEGQSDSERVAVCPTAPGPALADGGRKGWKTTPSAQGALRRPSSKVARR